jgi:hypothetical protein
MSKYGVNPGIITENLILYIDPNNKNFKYIGNTQFKNIAREPYSKFDVLSSNSPILSSIGAVNYLNFRDGISCVTETSELSSELSDYCLQIWLRDNNVGSDSDIYVKPIVVGGKNTITIVPSSVQIDNLDVINIPAHNLNGVYTPDGIFNGKIRYSKPSTIYPLFPKTNYVYWLSSDNSWNIGETLQVLSGNPFTPPLSTTFNYPKVKSFSNVAFPWQATTWDKTLSSIAIDIGEIYYGSTSSVRYQEYKIINNRRAFLYTDNSPVRTAYFYYDNNCDCYFLNYNNFDILSAPITPTGDFTTSINYLVDNAERVRIKSDINDSSLSSVFIPIRDKKGRGGRYNFYSLNTITLIPSNNNFLLDRIKRFEYRELPLESVVGDFPEDYSYFFPLSGNYVKGSSNTEHFKASIPGMIKWQSSTKRWYIYGYNYFGPYELYQSEEILNPTRPGEVTTWTAATTALCAYGGSPSEVTDSLLVTYEGTTSLGRQLYEPINFPTFEQINQSSSPFQGGYVYELSPFVAGVSAWHYVISNSINYSIAFSSTESVQHPWEVTQWEKAEHPFFSCNYTDIKTIGKSSNPYSHR